LCGEEEIIGNKLSLIFGEIAREKAKGAQRQSKNKIFLSDIKHRQ
jgi:hypothetical protein